MPIRIVTAALFAAWASYAQTPADLEFFESKIRPILARNCHSCHGESKQYSGLRLDSRQAALKGGTRGAALVPGKPEDSVLFKAVKHLGPNMPAGGKLSDAEIAALESWIRKGAAWPASASVSASADRYGKLARSHWAFKPVSKPAPPAIGKSNGVDRFIAAALGRAGLSAANPADRRVVLRRLSYVLTGLPPTAVESERFVNDRSPAAYSREVDRLLESPRFGEHWARHWLDLVRYGETRGYEWNYEIAGAWRYRDYVIRAFNADVPYDRFVREQIAGDLLPNPRINAKERINESIIGPAFYRLGEAGHDDCIQFREIALDVVDNQIDTLAKTFQALTVSCARCHNHKLDPIPTEDYYGLYGVLNGSRQVTHTIDTPEVNAAPIARMTELKKQIQQELSSLWRREAQTVRARLDRIQDTGALEDPGTPWARLRCETGGNEEFFTLAASQMAERYRKETAVRAEFNRANFTPFEDIRRWFASGMGLRKGPSPSGEFLIAAEGDNAINGIFPAGIYTNALSSRLNGALRSADLPKNKKKVSLRLMGGMLGARRTVIDNCAIGENYAVLERDRLAWTKLDTFSKEERMPIFLELVTKWDNPRYPDRPGRLKSAQEALLPSPRSFFGIAGAVLHDVDEAPREELTHMARLFENGVPKSTEELAERYASVIRDVVEKWSRGRATDDDARWMTWLVDSGILSNRRDASPRLASLVAEYRAAEATVEPPRVVEGLADLGSGRDYPVLVAGNAKSFGDPAPRRFLKHVFGETPLTSGTGSGRLELADAIASPANPLTARVMVNRIWHHLFGRGLVATVDNFGVIGDRPSHPELLDWLAAQFVEQGWSIKKLIRMIVLSETFQQSGETTAKARELDPQNALLHHYPLRRLGAEALRDSILISSGKLKDQPYGPSIDPARAQAKDYRRLFSGPVDGSGRRSIYLKVTRMEGAGFLETFDYPTPMATRGSRDVTNVPAQALAMLNDPFVTGEAETIARKLTGTTPESRVDELFRAALGRAPDSAERERFTGLARELTSLEKAEPASLTVWKGVAHAVLNLKEFLYVQ
ncbi:MAG: PSD1 and planctomycete cytochrome C domain-containing protein [Bryobacteraceae bacterium]